MASAVGLSLAVLSAVFNGSFAAFSKLESAGLVHPFIFNLYLALGVWASSCAVLPFMGLLGHPPAVVPLGALAGALFVGASSLSFVACANVGLSTAQGVWGGAAILVAFLWGTLGPTPVGLPVVSLPLSLLAAGLLLLGVAGIVKSDELGGWIEQRGRVPPTLEPLMAGGGAATATGTATSSGASSPTGDAVESPDTPPLTVTSAGAAAASAAAERGGGGGGSRPLGICAAASVGLFGGSVLVPLKFLPSDEFSGVASLAFLPSFGCGCLAAAASLAAAFRACRGEPVPLGSRGTLLAGLGSGLVWNLSNACQLLAMSAYSVPYGVAYPILQASLVVAGLLGIFLFREIRQPSAIAVFFACAATVVAGAVLLGVFGPSPAADPSAAEPSAAEPSAARPSDALQAPPTTALDAPPAAPPPGGHSSPDALEMLGKVLLEVMSIQLLGFLLKRSGAVTPVTEAGIGHYVAVVGFPCVLFSALAELQPAAGILPLMLVIGSAKALVFGAAYLIGSRSTSRAGGAPGEPLLRGALFAIFGTNSDDVGLGVPILGILFPGRVDALYVLAAMQALLFNPLAYVLLGVSGARSGEPAVRPSLAATLCTVLVGLRSNMLVLSVFAGLAYRLIVAAPLPWFASYPIELLGRPFQPLVYLIGGFGFVGAFDSLTSLPAAVLPLAVVALKSLCLPMAAFLAMRWVEPDGDYIFLYALLPCANSALVIARIYGASGPLLATLSSALALNKVAAFLLLFFAGILASESSPREAMRIKATFSFAMLCLSLAGGVCLALTGALTPDWRRSRGMRKLLAHFVLQGLLAASFCGIQAANHSLGMRPSDTPTYRLQYAAIDALRWSTNASLLLLALDWARSSRLRGKPQRRLGLGLHLAFSAAVGLAISLPFSLGAAGPPRPSPADVGTDYWLAYGREQALAFAVLYALFGTAKLACLLVVARDMPGRRRSQTVLLSVPAPGDTSPFPYPLSVGVLVAAMALKCLGQAGLCGWYYRDQGGIAQTTATVELVMVMVALEDGQGLLSFLLFGLQRASMDIVGRLCSCFVGGASPARDDNQQRVLAAYVVAVEAPDEAPQQADGAASPTVEASS